MNILNIKSGLILLMTLGVVFVAAAQASPPATPIDGGLSLLLAAGGAYGLKKLASKSKK